MIGALIVKVDAKNKKNLPRKTFIKKEVDLKLNQNKFRGGGGGHSEFLEIFSVV